MQREKYMTIAQLQELTKDLPELPHSRGHLGHGNEPSRPQTDEYEYHVSLAPDSLQKVLLSDGGA